MMMFLLLLVLIPTGYISAELYKDADTLYEILKERSNPSLRPRINQSDTVDVVIKLSLSFVVNLDEVHQFLTADLWTYFYWQDDLLSWNESDFGHKTEVILPVDSVWVPDIGVLHSRKPPSKGMSHIVLVNSSGYSRLFDQIETVTSCTLDVSKFPFDTQRCAIYLMSSQYEPNELNVTHFIVENLKITVNGEWYLNDLITSVDLFKIEMGLRQVLTLTLVLQRQPMFYIINLLLPIIIIAAINPFVFLVKTDTGEKVSIAVTLFLSFTVFISLLGDMLPQTSNSTSIVSLYVCAQFLLSGIYLMFCVGIQRVSTWGRHNYFCGCMMKTNDVQPTDQSGANGNSGNHEDDEDDVNLSKKTSLKLDRWMFFVSAGLSLILTLVTGFLIIS